MVDSALRASQMTLARFLRDPSHNPPPPGVEPRRLKIYQDLVYNNIEGFISSGFPVLRSLYRDSDWHGLVRAFIDQHHCRSPFFLEISQEFLQFLMQDHVARPVDPAFLVELAHYEWVELALDTSEEELPAAQSFTEVLEVVPRLSPLAWSLSYHFPVHRIGPGFRPDQSDERTYLVVYRNRNDEVRFMELNAATARLLEMIRCNESATARELLSILARELAMDEASITRHGGEQLRELLELSVVLVQSQ